MTFVFQACFELEKTLGKKITLTEILPRRCKQRKCSERAPFYTLFRKTGLKPVLTGTMSDLQVMGWGVFDACWREGVGGIPLMFRTKKNKV